MTQIIAVSNQKGGVAKTTTSISLGACLAENNHKTLLVDLDPQNSLSVSLGLNEETNGTTITDLFQDEMNKKPVEMKGVIKHSSFPGLDVIISDARLSVVERNLLEKNGYEYILKTIIDAHIKDYQYIILDCSPSLGPLTIMALTAAQNVIIPIQTEYLAAWGLFRLIETVEAVQEHTNPELKYFLLAVLYDQRNSICREVYSKLEEGFAEHLFNTIISIDTRLKECVLSGEPIIQFAPKTRASQQYRLLATEVMRQIPVSER